MYRFYGALVIESETHSMAAKVKHVDRWKNDGIQVGTIKRGSGDRLKSTLKIPEARSLDYARWRSLDRSETIMAPVGPD